MIGGVAGQGGFDPKSMSPRFIVGATGSTSYVAVVSVTGSGLIQSISPHININDVVSSHYLQIIIDGVTLFDSIVGNMWNIWGESTSVFSGNYKFNTSFTINAKVTQGTGYTAVSYLLN